MKLYRFDASVGHSITNFGSAGLVLAPIQKLSGPAQIACMYLAPSGIIGYHQADPHQLFLVVQGTGWVEGATSGRMPIAAGQAAFWTAGEWHGAGTDAGMTAIVIEGETLNPDQFMPALPPDL